ncbi:MAG: FumA C-terminus/TtdB family hydratase beta subunit [Methanomassiliicoccales archaeon]|nr:FumA C-terminus/TtdB family hydratase beta subunit [Methanomassiliicoccales archaeon]
MRLKAPLSEQDVRSLKVGDNMTLDGIIFTGRDEMHARALEYAKEGRRLPFDLRGGALYHCGPIVRKAGGKWHVIAAGPTTSRRMDSMEPELIGHVGVRAIIGKGGMSQPTVDAMAKHGCVYLAFTGGAAVLAAERITDVRGVEWTDLGMPEAMWSLEVKEFGPLIVAIDAHSESLYKKVEDEVASNLPFIRKRIGL